jgi:hypothetical protein
LWARFCFLKQVLASTEKKGCFDALLQFNIESKQKDQANFDPINIVCGTRHTAWFITFILPILVSTAWVFNTFEILDHRVDDRVVSYEFCSIVLHQSEI